MKAIAGGWGLLLFATACASAATVSGPGGSAWPEDGRWRPIAVRPGWATDGVLLLERTDSVGTLRAAHGLALGGAALPALAAADNPTQLRVGFAPVATPPTPSELAVQADARARTAARIGRDIRYRRPAAMITVADRRGFEFVYEYSENGDDWVVREVVVPAGRGSLTLKLTSTLRRFAAENRAFEPLLAGLSAPTAEFAAGPTAEDGIAVPAAAGETHWLVRWRWPIIGGLLAVAALAGLQVLRRYPAR
jgi:hypothetical protein